jgi:hypothetical protein
LIIQEEIGAVIKTITEHEAQNIFRKQQLRVCEFRLKYLASVTSRLNTTEGPVPLFVVDIKHQMPIASKAPACHRHYLMYHHSLIAETTLKKK